MILCWSDWTFEKGNQSIVDPSTIRFPLPGHCHQDRNHHWDHCYGGSRLIHHTFLLAYLINDFNIMNITESAGRNRSWKEFRNV